MNYDSMNLLIKTGSKTFSVFPYSFNTDENVTLNPRGITIIKSDYVGESVMGEILHIDSAQILVGTKNEVDADSLNFFCFDYAENPLGCFAWMGKFKPDIFLKELDYRHLGVHVKT